MISKNGKVLPIEVKAGARGQMQSMHLFLNARQLDEGLRVSAENFAAYDNIKTLPIYAIKNIFHADEPGIH